MQEKKLIFTEPEFDVIKLECVDVITTSDSADDDWWLDEV